MIKTHNINLAGQIFHINEDAYELLSDYFSKLRNFYINEEDKDEIIKDIEARFAELFLAKGKNYIITKPDVESVVKVMGNPQEFEMDDTNTSTTENTNSNSYQNNATALNTGKRLYRDMDNSVVAGVCAGISNYLGIADPIWIRIAFIILTFATASFWMFVIYPILWFIIPEALTSTQKLEMKGEPINLSNIEKKIKDDPAIEKSKGVLSQIINFIGSIVLFFFKGLLWFGIGIVILTGATIVFGLLVALIVLAVLTVMGIPLVNTFFFNSAIDGWMLGLGGFLIGIIPIIFIILAIVHVASKTSKPLKKQIIFPLIGLFLFGFLLLNISSYHAKNLLTEKKKINQNLALNYADINDTLQISMTPSIKDENYNNVNINGVAGLIDFVTEFDDKFVPVEIEIFTSANDSFYVVSEVSANGSNDLEAVNNATSFNHKIVQNKNKIVIDPYISFKHDKVKFRNQKQLIKVYVPEGKVIKWDRRTEKYIDLDKVDINFEAGDLNQNMQKVKKHKIEINANNSDNNKSTSANVSIKIDTDDKDINNTISKVEEEISKALEEAHSDNPNVDVNVNIHDNDNNDEDEDDYYSRQHYIFRMTNGELVPID